MKAIINAKLVYPDAIVDGVLLLADGKIVAGGDLPVPSDAEIIDAGGLYVGPGLFDIHCHGYARAGAQPEFYSTMDNPAAVAKAHLKAGTTSMTATMGYAYAPDEFLQAVARCREEIAKPDSSIVGIHFEGPYISPQYGSHSDRAWKYTDEMAEKILTAAGEDLLHCTYAPEMPTAPRLEALLQKHGVTADIGHTALSPADAERAVANGAKIATHLFDAMGTWRGQYNRSVLQENASTILLTFPELYYELICDQRGIHVQPYNAKLAMTVAGEDRIILVTDCVSRVSHNPADYPADDPKSAPDLNWNETGGLSGSRLILSDACRNFMNYGCADLRQAFKCASTNPARALKLDYKIGSILPGRDANLIFVDEDFRVKQVWFRGEKEADYAG